MIGLRFHGSRLLFSGRAAGRSVQYVIIETSWLGFVYQGQQDAADAGMSRILAWEYGYSPQLTTQLVHGLELVYR